MMISKARELYQYIDLIKDLAARELRIRYLGSIMGKYWNIVHPIIVIAMYTIIFSKLLGVRANTSHNDSTWAYASFLCAGLIPWNFFSELLQRSTGSFQEFAHLLKKVKFPLLVLHLSIVASTMVTFSINMAIYLLFLALTGHTFSATVLLLPVVVLLQALFTVGLGMITSVVNAFFRDMQQIIVIGLQLLFWATPVVYNPTQVPEKYRLLSDLNPMTHCIAIYRSVLLGEPVSWASVGTFTAIAFVLFAAGVVIIWKSEPEVLDQI